MRSILIALAATAVGFGGCQNKASTSSQPSAGSPASLASLPHRKAGLWKLTQTVSGVDGVRTSELCIDEASEAKSSLWSAGSSQKLCTVTGLSRGVDGSIRVASTCKMGSAGTISTVAVVSGDYSSRYSVHSDSTIRGAAFAPMNGQRSMVVNAEWTGPCPAGLVGGDMSVPGMGKVNMTKAPHP